ncbi:unnamed protein product [Didymodactylos carnosus]|uniref:Uncharacterized protein n=1 Tax=Didymodactylos carnosus TaxID=1234261 RepID=A0A815BDN5_9BILA|nr:unnamed protein product [Didymodactylos carnosus]CAF4055089.1 unnamed protein product [Didymodactylos carnosus]
MPGQLVAVYLGERGINVIVSIVAALACRTPFLLLEHSIPDLRLKAILEDARPTLVITDRVLKASLVSAGLVPPEQILVFDDNHDDNFMEEQQRELTATSLSSSRPHFRPDDTLYLIYTSGSSGTPKGVLVPHRAVWNRFEWMWRVYPWGDNERQVWKTSIMFVDSIWEMLGGLLRGVPTVIASCAVANDPYSLTYLIQRRYITRLTLIPTMLSSILKPFPDHGTRQQYFRSINLIIVSGETLTKIAYDQFRNAILPGVTLLNLYGSTETGADATFHEIDTTSDYSSFESIPIGKPIDNMKYIIIDPMNGPTEQSTGELLLAGAGLYKGYLNLPDMTKTKEVTIGEMVYFKTGDLVRLDERTGWLVFCGRSDTQVKIRGCRLELEEVKAVLSQYPSIKSAACFMNDEGQLIALYEMMTTDKDQDIDRDELSRWICSNLARFALPIAFYSVSVLPRTATRKIDRSKLPLTVAQLISHCSDKQSFDSGSNKNDHSSTFAPPSAIWNRALGIETSIPTANKTFTQLGGHSLLAIQIQREIYGIDDFSNIKPRLKLSYHRFVSDF